MSFHPVRDVPPQSRRNLQWDPLHGHTWLRQHRFQSGRPGSLRQPWPSARPLCRQPPAAPFPEIPYAAARAAPPHPAVRPRSLPGQSDPRGSSISGSWFPSVFIQKGRTVSEKTVRPGIDQKIRLRIKISIMAAMPMTSVIRVWVLYPSSGFISPKLVTTQK